MSYVDDDEGEDAAYYDDEEDATRTPLAPPAADADEEDHAELLAARKSGEHSLGGWHYAPLIVGLAPPLGAILGGGKADHWSDVILLLLSSFWLFQCLKVPHDIYYAARTRRILQQDEQEDSEDEDEGDDGHRPSTRSLRSRRRHLAIVELQRTEVIALAACIASPVVGAYLLQWLQANLHDGSRYLNQFNIRLFMMAAGIRPWTHAFKLLRRRLLLLQEDVHYPSAKVESLSRRLQRVEADLSSLRKSTASHSDVRTLRNGIDVPLSSLSRSLRKQEKRSELHRSNSEDKFGLVESRLEDLLRECAINAELIEAERIERERSGSLARNVLEAFKFAIGQRNTPPGVWQYQQRQLDGGAAASRLIAAQQYADNSNSQVVASAPAALAPREWYAQGMAYWAFLPLNIANSVLRRAGGGQGGENDVTTAARRMIAGNDHPHPHPHYHGKNGSHGSTASPTNSPPTSPPGMQSAAAAAGAAMLQPVGNPSAWKSSPSSSTSTSTSRNRDRNAPQLPPLQPTNMNINPLNGGGGNGGGGAAAAASPWKRVSRRKE